MSILPFVRQFANTDLEWFDNQNWPRVSWLYKFIIQFFMRFKLNLFNGKQTLSLVSFLINLILIQQFSLNK